MNTTNHTSPSDEDAANGAIGEREAFDADDAHAVWHEWLQMRGTDIDFKSQRAAIELVRYAMNRAALTAEKVAAEPVAEVTNYRDADGDLRTGILFHGDRLAAGTLLYAVAQPAQTQVAAEPVAWFTDDSQSDRSATTWDRNVADRWRAKGWPVHPLYTAPIAALEKGDGRDAERYRWLRDKFAFRTSELEPPHWSMDSFSGLGETFDDAIDAAMESDHE